MLVKNSYQDEIYSTPATRDLNEIIFLDSGKIQKGEAERANRHGYTKQESAKPLYPVKDAKKTLYHF